MATNNENHGPWFTCEDCGQEVESETDHICEGTCRQECERCGGEAGFERSPEGQVCSVCHRWLCNECIDFKASYTELYSDFVCKQCRSAL